MSAISNDDDIQAKSTPRLGSYRPPNMNSGACHLLFDISLRNISQYKLPTMRHAIKDSLQASSISTELKHAFMLTLTEILSNLIQHAKPTPKYIRIRLYQTRKQIILDIADNAAPFEDFNERCKESIERVIGDILSESGRGLGIIAQSHSYYQYLPANRSSDLLNHFIVGNYISNEIKTPQGKEKENSYLAEKENTKIFIIDDDPVYCMLVDSILNTDYQTCVFDNAKDALSAFPKERPDLIISDLSMPDMDGKELRAALSELEGGDSTPFVFLSGHEEEARNQYLNSLGIDDFLCKPVEKDHLRAVVARLNLRSQQLKATIESSIGHEITKSLEPTLPDVLCKWQCFVKHNVAEIGGGDFLLYEKVDDGCSIVLADVMGHGLGAKFIAYSYAGYLRSLFKLCKNIDRPDLFLSQVSEAVNADSFLDSNIMTCLASWITSKGEISISSAGHPWPIHVSDSVAKPIAISGPLPGLLGTTEYSQTTLKLKPNDFIILYTDGLFENVPEMRQDPEYAIQEICRICENEYETKQALLDAIWYRFSAHEKTMRDDVTLIMLKYAGTSQDE